MIHATGLTVIAVIGTEEQVVAVIRHERRVMGNGKRGKKFWA
jgi:hypothetical protein